MWRARAGLHEPGATVDLQTWEEVNSMADKKREEKKDVGKKPDKEKETK
jgi:hypothetical protein